MSEECGIGRYSADLPDVDRFVTLGEGNTPLIKFERLGRKFGVDNILAKMESHNPTGSYKDRVAAMSMSLALAQNCRGWIATSSGNAGLAMAAFGNRGGLPGFLCLVASAPPEKRAPLIPYELAVFGIAGVGDHANGCTESALFAEVQSAAERYGLYLGTTAHRFNPEGMRGIDTISYELVAQAPGLTHVYIPTGGGGLLTAIARGFAARGAAPKIIACQPSGCAPIVRFLDGELSKPSIDACTSGISALQLPHPPDGRAAAEAVVESGGWGTNVEDDAVIEAQKLLASTEGVFVEPAAAAPLAALISDMERGRLTAHDTPVLVITGAGWKDLARFGQGASLLPTIDVGNLPQTVAEWSERVAAVRQPSPPGGRSHAQDTRTILTGSLSGQ